MKQFWKKNRLLYISHIVYIDINFFSEPSLSYVSF